jgi:hypothetical protein
MLVFTSLSGRGGGRPVEPAAGPGRGGVRHRSVDDQAAVDRRLIESRERRRHARPERILVQDQPRIQRCPIERQADLGDRAIEWTSGSARTHGGIDHRVDVGTS